MCGEGRARGKRRLPPGDSPPPPRPAGSSPVRAPRKVAPPGPAEGRGAGGDRAPGLHSRLYPRGPCTLCGGSRARPMAAPSSLAHLRAESGSASCAPGADRRRKETGRLVPRCTESPTPLTTTPRRRPSSPGPQCTALRAAAWDKPGRRRPAAVTMVTARPAPGLAPAGRRRELYRTPPPGTAGLKTGRPPPGRWEPSG